VRDHAQTHLLTENVTPYGVSPPFSPVFCGVVIHMHDRQKGMANSTMDEVWDADVVHGCACDASG